MLFSEALSKLMQVFEITVMKLVTSCNRIRRHRMDRSYRIDHGYNKLDVG